MPGLRRGRKLRDDGDRPALSPCPEAWRQVLAHDVERTAGVESEHRLVRAERLPRAPLLDMDVPARVRLRRRVARVEAPPDDRLVRLALEEKSRNGKVTAFLSL